MPTSTNANAAGITENVSAGRPVGHTTGQGGAVTQLTSDSTAVTLNEPCGQITTFALVLATGVDTNFTVNNDLVESTDVVAVSVGSYGGTADGIPVVDTVATADGSFDIHLKNGGGVTLDAVAVINFIVHKAVAS